MGTLRIQQREDSFSGDVGDIILRLWLYLVCTSAAVVRDAAYPHLSSVNKAHAEQIRCLSMCAHTHTHTHTHIHTHRQTLSCGCLYVSLTLTLSLLSAVNVFLR